MSAQTFREHFVARFPDASERETLVLVLLAEQIVGEGPVATEYASELLDVAEAKLKEGI